MRIVKKRREERVVIEIAVSMRRSPIVETHTDIIEY